MKTSAAEKVIIDPSKGGAVSPKAAQQSHALEVSPGAWMWQGIVALLEVDLFSANWESRHGAAMALRELLKVQGLSGGMKGDTFYDCAKFLINHVIQTVCLRRKILLHTNVGVTI